MHTSDPIDVHLLQRIAAHNTAALAELYDRHSRLLFGLILRIVRDRGEAEDILQEAFGRVWTRRDLRRASGWTAAVDRMAGAQLRDRSPARTAEPRRDRHVCARRARCGGNTRLGHPESGSGRIRC
jgi:RNA polymerase sigma-70 factor (ECF subfamily)